MVEYGNALEAIQAKRAQLEARLKELRGPMTTFPHARAFTGGKNGRYRKASSQVQNDPAQAGSAWSSRALTWAPFVWAGSTVVPFDHSGAYDSIEDAGIRAGEVEAWRCWRVDGGKLFSTYVDRLWVPGEVMVGNAKEWGVHGWKDRDETARYAEESYHYRLYRLPFVLGRVEMWGEIIEHEKGYRAEFAAITSLDEVLTDMYATDLDALRKLYLPSLSQVPVEQGEG